MQVEVLNHQGKGTGRSVELPKDIFAIEQPNEHAVYLAVKQYLAAQRQGTAKVKGRSEVQGSTRKLHRQKGTGGSRKGNIRNPLYKGGGTVHGPEPRDYSFKLNKKVKDLARTTSLTVKAQKEAIRVIENLDMDTPKTKTAKEMFMAMDLDNKKVLFVDDNLSNEVFLSMRNLCKVNPINLAQTNTYEVMHADVLVFTERAMEILNTEVETAEAESE